MSITIPVVSTSGAKSTVTLTDPVVNQPSGQPVSVGETAVLPGSDSGNGNLLLANPVTVTQAASAAGPLQSMSFYATLAAGQLILGFYDATGPGGGPGALKAETAPFVTVNGWNTAAVKVPVTLPAGQYWMAYNPQSNNLQYGYQSASTYKYYTRTFGSPLPATFSTTPTSGTGKWNLYATFGGSAPTPPPPPPAPTVTSLQPTTASAGGNVFVSGTSLAGTTSVKFGAASATFSVSSDTLVSATVPAGTGTVDVTVTTTSGTSALSAADRFTYGTVTPPPPGGLPTLWNASPPAGVCLAPNGPFVGTPGQFDYTPLAGHEIWDHFDGPAGSNPDSRLWVEDTTNQGGVQVYDPARSFLDGSSHAVLEAIWSNGTVRSGRFTSVTKWAMQYGWYAARIKFPTGGKSFFPAHWLLFVGYNTNPGKYGEIDIMEFFGNTTEYSTHLWFGDGNPNLQSQKTVPSTQSGGVAGNDYHTYWMQWEPDRMQFGVDDFIVGEWHSTDSPVWSHMQQPFYAIENFAVGPSFLPAPVASEFPSRMLIDWIWYKPL